MKNSYVIRTSEDGTLGVFSNKKKVYEAVKKLMDRNWQSVRLFISTDSEPKPTYQNISKELRETGFVTLYDNDMCSINIEHFTTNFLY